MLLLSVRRIAFTVLASLIAAVSVAHAETNALSAPIDRVAKSNHVLKPDMLQKHTVHRLDPHRDSNSLRAKDHPLWPALEMAVDSYKHIRRNVHDYSCLSVRRERVNGVLQAREFMTAKVRHRKTQGGVEVVPFSVYMKVVAPSAIKGREVLYVQGQNDGDMLIRKGGKRFSFLTTRLRPDSDAVMSGNRYPMTEFGVENLMRRLIQVVKQDMQSGLETSVEFFHDAKVEGRDCTGIRVTHPHQDDSLLFHTATVFMDDEHKLPVHYEAYGWPKEENGDPVLLEQYTYRNIRVNPGFSDYDFAPNNRDYKVQ